VLSLALVLGLLPRAALLLLWTGYLSLCTAGAVFLNFQWDALLLETGLLAIFLAPAGLRPDWRGGRPPSRAFLWLLRWVLFRVMFLSGLVKLLWDDPRWWPELSALEFHYWTQPLPHRISHFAHHMPAWFQRVSIVTMFAIELAVPFLFFGPRWARTAGCAATVFLMASIAGTGNYGFFEPLIVVLCVTLLDDRTLGRLVPRSLRERWSSAPRALSEPASRLRSGARSLRSGATAIFTALVLILTAQAAARGMRWARAFPEPLATLERWSAPLRSFNSYGLFRVMTTQRPEIEIEGSRDALEWRRYEFRWKPGAVDRAPRVAGPHMPRLDGQMWFAGLSGVEGAGWYAPFASRLLEGTPEVLALLAGNPFPGEPPRYLRSTVYFYTFRSPAERRAGTWWRRERAGRYCATLELVDGELRAVRW